MTNQVVLITGGNRGIGRATALALAKHGARVIICGRDMIALRQLETKIHARGDQCLALYIDVTDPISITKAIRQANEHYGRIDVLVNNAGILHFADIANTSSVEWARILATNLTGPFQCIQAVLPIMKAQSHGHIINIASQAGLYGFPNLGAYSASKFGLIGLSQSLGRELQDSGIKVSYVCPGAVKTEMLATLPDAFTGPMPKDTPENIAQCICDLIAEPNATRQQTKLWNRLTYAVKRRLGLPQVKVWSSWINTVLVFVQILGLSFQATTEDLLLTGLPAVSAI